MMGTGSTVTLFQQLRNRVLTAQLANGTLPLSQTIGERFYYNLSTPPDAELIYPFLSGRLINQQISGGGQRLRADFEVMVIDRPRSRLLAVETIADRVEGALHGYREARWGFVMANPPKRDTIEPPPPPGDRELVQVRLVFEIIAYPQRLADYAVPG